MDIGRGQSLIIKHFGYLPLRSNTHVHKSPNNFKLKMQCSKMFQLCVIMERGKMFRLSFDLLLSIVPDVRFTKVFTRKSLRSMEDRFGAARAERLKPSGSRKSDHVVGIR